MATFALVHGSWHGAWCWERLEPELAARGHRAIAIDLPIEDPDAGLGRHADAAWAVSRLRPQSAAPRLEAWPLDALPDVDRTSIVCRDERVIAPAWSRTMSRDLLG